MNSIIIDSWKVPTLSIRLEETLCPLFYSIDDSVGFWYEIKYSMRDRMEYELDYSEEE